MNLNFKPQAERLPINYNPQKYSFRILLDNV